MTRLLQLPIIAFVAMAVTFSSLFQILWLSEDSKRTRQIRIYFLVGAVAGSIIIFFVSLYECFKSMEERNNVQEK